MPAMNFLSIIRVLTVCFAVLAVLFPVSWTPIFAQAPPMQQRPAIIVSGTVRDSAGTPIVDASVFFEEKATAASIEAKTDHDGTFSFLSLRAGSYLVHDMEVISKLHGQFGWSEPWAQAMHNWKLGGFAVDGFKPPLHPKLKHYNSRRFAHMIKLSMIASIDRGNSLQLEKQDFNTAMGWMLEAELTMPRIFESGVASQDNEGMSEIIHFVKTMGQVSEAKIVNFARTRVKFATNIPKLIEVLEAGQEIVHCGNDKLGLKIFKSGQQ